MAKRSKKNPFVRQLLNTLPAPLRSPFIIVLILFGIWMVFFDSANVLTQWRLFRTVEKLETDRAYYQNRIKAAEAEKAELEEHLEEYAREKYYMKKSNEDVFIIEEQTEEQ